jgi:large exoprotein involved in heme utilization and adhesion
VNLLGVSNEAQYPTPGIYTSVSGNGARAGDITIETRRLNITNGGWLQSVLSFGFDPVTFMPFPITDSRTGDITVRASDIELSRYNPFPSSFFRPSAITTLVTGGSRNISGDINIDAERVRLINGGRISTDLLGFNIPGFAEFSASGTSGNISIRAAESLDIEGVTPFGLTGAIISSIQPFASGQGGNIAIDTGRLRLANGGTISTALAGNGFAGNVNIRAADISVSDPVVDSVSQTVSGITVAVARDAVGQGGNLTLQADRLHVVNGGQITSSTQGNGAAGNINLRVNNIDVQGRSQPLLDGTQLPSAITASSTTAADAGSVAIKADTVRVRDQAEITVTNSGTGDAGNLRVNANTILLDHDGNLLASTVSGGGGNINLQANTIRLGQGSSINASTETGHGGDVQLQVRDTLQLNGQSQILADAHQAGRSGNVSVTASNTVLNDRSRISTNAQGTAVGGALSIQSDRFSLSNGSRITATTSGTGSGGRITLGGDRVSLVSGSQITASTTGTGRAGSLTLRANDGISLSGRNTRLAATSTTDAAAGSILLQTPDLQLDDHAAISVSGQGQGGAGNLTVRANTIQLNRKSTLSADVAGGDQGNITLQSNLLLLRRGSRNSTNATGTASGGNIGIDTDFIAAVEGENSDITANATNSFGGRISINATGIFGTQFRPQLTPFSDITASSGLGAAYSGTVSISNPDVDPGSDMVQLPENVVDASDQVATGCGEYANSRFIATGRGGIPNNPSEQVVSDRPWSDVRDISSFMNTPSNRSTTATVSEPVTTAQITEINSWVRNANGQVELMAVTPHEPDFTHATCSATSGQ